MIIYTWHNVYLYYDTYFIISGHGLKSIDLVCMKKLDTKVNIIPIIAKADTISKTELQKFKVNCMNAYIAFLFWLGILIRERYYVILTFFYFYIKNDR